MTQTIRLLFPEAPTIYSHALMDAAQPKTSEQDKENSSKSDFFVKMFLNLIKSVNYIPSLQSSLILSSNT